MGGNYPRALVQGTDGTTLHKGEEQHEVRQISNLGVDEEEVDALPTVLLGIGVNEGKDHGYTIKSDSPI